MFIIKLGIVPQKNYKGDYHEQQNLDAQEENITKFVEDFANNFQKEVKLNVKEIIPIYDNTDTIIGCSVSLHYDSIYYGYVNLDFRCDNIITEFCIERNAISPNEKLTEDVQKFEKSHDTVVEDKLYKVDTFNYAIKYKNKKNL